MENSSDSNTVPEEAPVWFVDVGADNEGNEYLNSALQEHFVLKQVVNIRQGPKYPAYCLLIHRVRSFENIVWPETSPTAILLAEAGFFYDGELTTFPSFPLANTIWGQVFLLFSFWSVTGWSQQMVFPLRWRTSELAF